MSTNRFGKKFSLDAESPVVQASEQILNKPATQRDQGGVEQQTLTPDPLTLKGEGVIINPTEQPAVASIPSSYKGEGWGDGPVLKNVGAKIPYSIYDRLERIKRQSERSGVKADKRNIGDLVAQAIKEFVEKYDAQ